MKILEGKRGLIFGALDEKSIAWKVAEQCHAQGAKFVLTNAPIAMRMGVINELSENLNSVVAKVNSGEGTLGKLVNDDRLYYDALNSVRKLKNAVETQEDLAPLTTITAAFGVMTLF